MFLVLLSALIIVFTMEENDLSRKLCSTESAADDGD